MRKLSIFLLFHLAIGAQPAPSGSEGKHHGEAEYSESKFDEIEKLQRICEEGVQFMKDSATMDIQLGIWHFFCKHVSMNGGKNGEIESMKTVFKMREANTGDKQGDIRMKEKEKGKTIGEKEKGPTNPHILSNDDIVDILSDDGASHHKNGRFLFEFTVYMEKEFEQLRKLFKIVTADLLESLITGKLEVHSTTSAGSSSFFFSADGKFLLKKVLAEELDFFFKIENGKMKRWSEEEIRKSKGFNGGFYNSSGTSNSYIQHMMERTEKAAKTKTEKKKTSLLPKFYMLLNIRKRPNDPGETFILMDWLFPKNIKFKFDLKGSVINREVNSAELRLHKDLPTLRDLDFASYAVHLCAEQNLLNLDKEEISHFDMASWFTENEDERERQKPNGGKFQNGIGLSSAEQHSELMDAIDMDLKFLVGHNIMDYSFLLGIITFKEKGKDESINICSAFWQNSNGNDIEGNHDAIIFAGIIDMLQPYSFNRKVEREFLHWYTLVTQGKYKKVPMPMDFFCRERYPFNSITNPVEYSNRFKEYLKNVVFKIGNGNDGCLQVQGQNHNPIPRT